MELSQPPQLGPVWNKPSGDPYIHQEKWKLFQAIRFVCLFYLLFYCGKNTMWDLSP